MPACLDRPAKGLLETSQSQRPVHFGRFCRQGETMSLINPEDHQPPEPPRGHIRMVYLGPVAPHWEVESEFGDRAVIEEFRLRALARLVLLPPHDPQFRRNRERIVRDAERENLILEWDFGVPEEEVALA
jgi:hypothetical protein